MAFLSLDWFRPQKELCGACGSLRVRKEPYRGCRVQVGDLTDSTGGTTGGGGNGDPVHLGKNKDSPQVPGILACHSRVPASPHLHEPWRRTCTHCLSPRMSMSTATLPACRPLLSSMQAACHLGCHKSSVQRGLVSVPWVGTAGLRCCPSGSAACAGSCLWLGFAQFSGGLCRDCLPGPLQGLYILCLGPVALRCASMEM